VAERTPERRDWPGHAPDISTRSAMQTEQAAPGRRPSGGVAEQYRSFLARAAVAEILVPSGTL